MLKNLKLFPCSINSLFFTLPPYSVDLIVCAAASHGLIYPFIILIMIFLFSSVINAKQKINICFLSFWFKCWLYIVWTWNQEPIWHGTWGCYHQIDLSLDHQGLVTILENDMRLAWKIRYWNKFDLKQDLQDAIIYNKEKYIITNL